MPNQDLTEWVFTIRSKLGLSQSKLADMLGVSPRAIQSYEQGWRVPPRPFAMQLMTVLALHVETPPPSQPCWRLTGCPAEARNTCAAHSVGRGRSCWQLSGRSCGKHRGTGRSKTGLPCIGCEVMTRLLDSPCRRAAVGATHVPCKEEEI
jgi:DNA-binding XRE family transcriptional regulator